MAPAIDVAGSGHGLLGHSRRRILWTTLLCVPALGITIGAIVRSAAGWNDYRGYLIVGEAIRQGVYSDHVFNNWPPFFAVFAVALVELAKAPAPLARVAWATFNTVVFAIACARWLRVVHAEKDPIWILPVALFFVSPFLVGHIVYHQINALIFAMAMEGCLSAGRGDDARGGFWIGLGASLKVTPVLLLPYFLLQRRWKLVATAVGTAAVCALMVVPFLGWRGTLDAHRRWADRTIALRGIHGTRNQSIHALVERLTTNEARLEDVGIAPPVHLGQKSADAMGKLLSLALLIAGTIAVRKTHPERAAASLLPISVLSATYCWRPQLIVFAPLVYLSLRRLAKGGDLYDWVLAVPFLAAIFEREQSIIGENIYQVLEGAGLTCALAVLIVLNSLRWNRPEAASEKTHREIGDTLRRSSDASAGRVA